VWLYRARAGVAAPARGKLQVVSMGNSNENGIFAPLVRTAKGIIGQKPFNQLRGKGIALHSQVRPTQPFASLS